MVATTEKQGVKGVNFNSLLSQVVKSPGNTSFLKTAAETGVLTNGEFMVAITDDEKTKIAETYGENELFRFAGKTDVSFLPKICEIPVEKPKSIKAVTRLTVRDHNFSVDGAILQFMMKRYPNASLYLSGDRKYLMVSDKGLKGVIKVKKEETDEQREI